MSKFKLRYGHEFITCPICGSKTFDYISYSEWGWGIVEQHGYCVRCGYCIQQAYSPVVDGFLDIKKGFKTKSGNYIPKDIKRHKRIRRKLGINDIDINPEWILYV